MSNHTFKTLGDLIQGPAARRWTAWFVTAFAVSALVATLLPVVRGSPAIVHSTFVSLNSWQRVLATLAVSVAVVAALFHVLSPRLAHLRWHVSRRHPPLWLAWVAAAATTCAADLSLGLGPTGFEVRLWEWALYCGGATLLVSGYRFVDSARESVSRPTAATERVSVEQLLSDWPTLERWLVCEKPADDDLVGNRRVAARLAGYLTRGAGTVGLVGPFGSGKSSVVKWLQEEVASAHLGSGDAVLFAEQSCWGFEDSAAAVRQILTRATEAVGREADCFSIRSLPESYRKTFTAGGDWLRSLADVALGVADPLEQFRHLSGILAVLNARLVVIVEDLDRTTSARFDRQEVFALLQRLRDVPRVSFVLATGQTADIAKLCDHVEVLRDFGAGPVAGLVQAVRSRCLAAFPDVTSGSTEDNPWGVARYMMMSRYDTVSLPEAAAGLLKTPRALKHSLRRTHLVWRTLHGEVDFDDLLAVNVLRFGAPEAFDFLVRHWDRLHQDIDGRTPGDDHAGGSARDWPRSGAASVGVPSGILASPRR